MSDAGVAETDSASRQELPSGRQRPRTANEQAMPFPNVILLNGTSSAGKTSIARALQADLPGLWMHVGLDHFLTMMPLKLHGVPSGMQWLHERDGALPVQLGDEGYAVIESFHRAVAAIAVHVPVVVDDVIFEPRLLAHWLETLSDLDVFFVAVDCELEELERREVARGDRPTGQARWQVGVVHSHGCYDFTVDTTATSAYACAGAIVDALKAGQRSSAFAVLRSRAALSESLPQDEA
jgi:chloramphenicol 3-O phosphotransferase